MPALSFAVLLAVEYAAQNGIIKVDLPIYALTELAAFFLPFLIVNTMAHRAEEEIVYRYKGFKPAVLPFVLLISVTLAFMSFLINWLMGILFQLPAGAQSVITVTGNYGLLPLLAVAVLVPALCEELFFRGAFFSAVEPQGVYAAIISSALAFALVHGDAGNVAGPFAAGLVYAYIVYFTGSVWPSIIAHFINNSLTFGINFMVGKYSSFILWQYFVVAALLIFFLFLYLSMGRLEKLIEKGYVQRIKRTSFTKAFSAIFFSPGLWLLAVMFFIKAISA